jgi:YidC/Oxa1 family membrane protein insertase
VVLASAIGSVGQPFYILFARILSFYYDLIPNYAIAIALLTVTVMVVVFPITLKGTRGMIKMQLLAPEMKVLQNRLKPTPGMSVEERQAARQKLNEEMMALYKENDTSPAGGCVPMFLQLPVFFVLYGTIRGLVHVNKGHIDPLYISKTSRIYNDIVAGHGHLRAFGINLANSVRSAGGWGSKAPFIALILVAIALQYIQMKQMSGRNPAAAAANPQMQTMQRVMPVFFALIYISIPAGVNVYFIVSSLFRIGQQDAMYRWDPKLQASLERLKKNTANAPPAPSAGATFRQRFRDAAGGAQPSNGTNGSGASNGSTASNGNSPEKGGKSSYTPPRVQPANRSKNKKPRRSR